MRSPKIAINTHPGEPPSLLSGMRNISLSHCKDAIFLVWHESKNGIDIERTDRKFNHFKFAEKYFFVLINQFIIIILQKMKS